MIRRLFLSCIICLGLSACGFQLRGTGQANLSGHAIYLFSETPFGALEKNVLRELQIAGASLTDSPQQANLRVMLGELQFETQGASRDSTGRANEVILRAKLVFQLQAGEPLATEASEVETRQLKTSRSYYQDYRNPVSEQNLQKEAREQIINELSARLLTQIQWSVAR